MTKDEAIKFIRTEYDRLDKICNVDTSKIDISISGRMTRKLGMFIIEKKLFREELSIRISSRIIDDENLFMDVIRHEYAHAIVHIRDPRHRHLHDKVWKNACREVGCIPRATRRIEQIDNN